MSLKSPLPLNSERVRQLSGGFCGCGGEAAARAGKRDACRYDAAAAAAQNSKRYLLIVGSKRLPRHRTSDRARAGSQRMAWQYNG